MNRDGGTPNWATINTRKRLTTGMLELLRDAILKGGTIPGRVGDDAFSSRTRALCSRGYLAYVHGGGPDRYRVTVAGREAAK